MMKNRIASQILLSFAVLLTSVGARADVTLNSVRLGGMKVESLAEFYIGAFGLKEVNRLPTQSGPEIFLNFGVSTEAAKGNHNPPIVLMHRDSNDIADPIAHLILNVTDMDLTVTSITSAGGSMPVAPRAFGNSGVVIAIAADPAGNRIELIQGPQ